MSETTRKTWDDVFAMNVYEFFNIVSYIRWKNEKQKESIRKWKQSH